MYEALHSSGALNRSINAHEAGGAEPQPLPPAAGINEYGGQGANGRQTGRSRVMARKHAIPLRSEAEIAMLRRGGGDNQGRCDQSLPLSLHVVFRVCLSVAPAQRRAAYP